MHDSIYSSHTDLALEIQEELQESDSAEKKGYRSSSRLYCDGRIQETQIVIDTVQAARRFGKTPGTYITLEGVDLTSNDGGFHDEMSRCIASNLRKLLGNARKILVVGLGNRSIMADALGPLVVDHLLITRPFYQGQGADREDEIDENNDPSALTGHSDPERITSAIAPGVMSQTGMEAAEIIRGIIAQTLPEKIIAIDALAARNLDRLGSTVQLSSTGIAPGSGIGNRRKEISEATLGVPVIAVGVPTVISIPAVADSILESCTVKLPEEFRQALEEKLGRGGEDYYRFLSALLDRRLFEFCMTPKDVDEAVKRISYTISEGINQAVFPHFDM